MRTAIYKQTYSDGRAYRYHVLDEAGDLRYVAEPTGLLLPSPKHLVDFFDPDRKLVGRLQPSDVARWPRGKRYELFVDQEVEEPCAVIREWLRLVDMLLLRLPRYEVQLGPRCYVGQGSRYGDRFYEILRLHEGGEEEAGREEIDGAELDDERVGEKPGQGMETCPEGKPKPRPDEGVKVGQIMRPTAGPSYVVDTDAAPLHQAPLVLVALVILIDMELYA
jgi:hypothetical protein